MNSIELDIYVLNEELSITWNYKMHFFKISYTKYVIDFEDKKIPKRIISKSTVYTILLFWKLRI